MVPKKRFEVDFQDSNHGSNLRFPLGMILAIFNLQINPILPIKFRVKWSYSSGVDSLTVQNFQDCGHGSHLVLPIVTILAISHLQVT